MSNTAENFSPESTDVDGLDDLYSLEAQPDPDQVQGHPAQEAQADPALRLVEQEQGGIPLAEAADLLELHIDTVRKRLQKGKLAGYKADDKFGQKWFVCVSELSHLHSEAQPDPDQVLSHPTQEAQADPALTQADRVHEIDETQDDPGQVQSHPTQEIQDNPVQEQDQPANGVHPDPAKLLAVIENQSHQLKAAGDVIMYMRSQLEEKDLQLKLLTDSQKKPTKWQQFITWFMGR